jgi:hypothetical protein
MAAARMRRSGRAFLRPTPFVGLRSSLIAHPHRGGSALFKRLRNTIAIGLVAATVASAFGTNAFTASNTGSGSKAGAGSAAISGYAVTNVAYTTSGADITGVAFNLDGAANSVKVQLSSGRTEYECGAPDPVTYRVTCATAEPASAAATLTVVASQ